LGDIVIVYHQDGILHLTMGCGHFIINDYMVLNLLIVGIIGALSVTSKSPPNSRLLTVFPLLARISSNLDEASRNTAIC